VWAAPMRPIAILVLAVLLAACANPINERTAVNYYLAGQAALARGDLRHAREMYSRALINARLGHMGPIAEAEALSKLARVEGNLCEYDEAEAHMLEARDLNIKAFAGEPNRTVPIRMELAQFSYDIARYQKAAQYFEEAFAADGGFTERVDPVVYSRVTTDYADALARVGNIPLATELRARAAAAASKGGAARVGKGDDYVRYPTSCK
jgi:tetratricopeptide (TPR) repeat protein